jgi:hypothetical protein
MATISPILLAIMVILVIVTIAIFIYVFAIRANSTGGATVMTCSAPPAAPTNVIAFIATSNSITATWDSTTNANTYNGYISAVNNFPNSTALIVTSTGTTSTTFSNLTTGMTYYIKITALNTCGESSSSIQVSIFLPYVPPNNFVIRNHNDNVVQLTMNPSNGVNSYRNYFTSNCTAANCHYQFQPDNSITLSSDNTRCLTVVSSNQLWTLPCTSSTLSNRQWTYNSSDNSLCLSSDLTGSCLNLPPGFTDPAGFGQFAVIAPKTNNALSAWDLVQV